MSDEPSGATSDTLRRAAAVLRELAEAATDGPWRPFTDGVRNGDHWYVVAGGEAIAHIASNDGVNEAQREPDASYMAMMHPPVGLALADWMDLVARLLAAGFDANAETRAAVKTARAVLDLPTMSGP